jgi:hypothetical protein
MHFPQSQVMRDSKQPGLRGRFLPELSYALTGLFKHLLRHILCQSPISVQHTATVVKDRIQVCTGEQFKRTSVISCHDRGLYLPVYTLAVNLGHVDNSLSKQSSMRKRDVSKKMESIIQGIVFFEKDNSLGFCLDSS